MARAFAQMGEPGQKNGNVELYLLKSKYNDLDTQRC
jgi:hypothetical protein